MLNVLMLASENDALPKGKVGGIGDVIRDIPKFLAAQNVHVDVLIPGYGWQANANKSTLVATLDVPFKQTIKKVELYKIAIAGSDNVQQWVLEHPDLCVGEPGQIYFDDGPHKPFCSDADKFALFSAAACELLVTIWQDKINVLHLHDWHTAFVTILREYAPRYKQLKTLKTVYSIHNLAIQGTRPLSGDEASLQLWFPDLVYNKNVINDPRYTHCINPTRAAINLADAIHLVSPTYAQEVMLASDHDNGFVGGEFLEHDLITANNEKRLFGFLNGCDYDHQPPAPKSFNDLMTLIAQTIDKMHGSDRHIKSAHYIAQQRCKLWLEQGDIGPTLISVGRLTEQKIKLLLLNSATLNTELLMKSDVDISTPLVIDVLLTEIGKHSARLILLGSGDPVIEDVLTQVMMRNENILFINGYGEGLSQNLYVNGDLFLMPSSFEPCGISQMLAMRVGQPCIAHKVGGLSDTISHLETGFLFSGNTLQQQTSNLLIAVQQALTMLRDDRKSFKAMKRAAKAQRFYWHDSISCYIRDLYNIEKN